MKLQRAMIATDFSPGATEALRRAAMLARLGSINQLTVVHVLQRSLLDELRDLIGRSEDEQITRAAEAQLFEQADELRDRSGCEVKAQLLDGERRQAIIEEALRAQTALIVVGARGVDDARRLLLGSTSDRIVSESPTAVLVVKRRVSKCYRRVLVPVDLQTPPDEAFKMARALAPGAELVLMHAFEVPFEGQLRNAGVDESEVEFYRARARNAAMHSLYEERSRLIDSGESCQVTAMRGVAHRTILVAEQSLKPDLLVLPRHSAGRVERWLLGSVARRVLEHCRSDIAVLPP